MTESSEVKGVKVSTEPTVLGAVLADEGSTRLAIWDRDIPAEVQACLDNLDMKKIFRAHAEKSKKTKLGKYFSRFSRQSHITLYPSELKGDLQPLGDEMKRLAKIFGEATGLDGAIRQRLTFSKPRRGAPEFTWHHDKYPVEKGFVGISIFSVGEKAKGGEFEYIAKDNEICMEEVESGFVHEPIGDVPVERMPFGDFGIFTAGYKGDKNSLIHRGSASAKGYRCRIQITPSYL